MLEWLNDLQWYWMLFLILGSMIGLMVLGMPVPFAFLLVCTVGGFVYYGVEYGIYQVILNMRESVMDLNFLPLPLFVLMGVVIFYSGIGSNMLDTMDKLIGRIPGRLGLIAVAGGTLFATLSGSSMASTALLGTMLVPEMERRGYKKCMSLGPILGSGGLAVMIPPSAIVIFVAAIGHVSVGGALIAIIMPGLLMALLYAAYIIGRSWLQPHIAPAYDVTLPPWRDRMISVAKYILPLGFILFAVLGVIFFGIATPTEAAATGALSTFILAAAYGRMNWTLVKKATWETLTITVMIFMIIVCAKTYSQILAFSGASEGLLMWTSGLPFPPVGIVGFIMVILILVGMVMSVPAMLMIATPLWMPVVAAMGYHPVWFLVLLVLNVEMAGTSPPYGLGLFVMKGVAPPDTKMTDCYWAAMPFLYCDAIVMVLLLFYPQIALWLPGLM